MRLPAGWADETGGWLGSLPGALGTELGWIRDCGCPGADLRADGDGTGVVEVRAYFDSLEAARHARTQLRRALQALQAAPFPGTSGSDAGWQAAAEGELSAVSEAEARRWLAAWRRTLAPVRVGSLLVRPVERLPAPRRRGRRSAGRGQATKAARGGLLVVRIRPGMAFGTGHHPTTCQALWALEQAGAAARMVDVGTGSGILAVAGALLGFREVLAVDLDPRAVEEARRHVAANGVGSRVRVMAGSAAQALRRWGSGTAHLVVANLTGPVLAQLAEPLAALVAPGGRLIGAGITPEGVGEVVEAWEACGLQVELCGEWGPWAWLEAVRGL